MRELDFLYLDETIELEKNTMYTFVIENKKALYEIEKFVRFEFSGNDYYFSYKINGKPIELDATAIVIDDVFALDVNTKKNINALYKMLSGMYGYKAEEEIEHVKDKIRQIVKEISLDLDIELMMSETVKDDDLFKIMDLKIKDTDGEPIKRLTNFINISYELRKCTLFFVFRLHEYFEKDEIEAMVREIAYKNIRIINIESSNVFEKIEEEQVVIYDNDLCTIR